MSTVIVEDLPKRAAYYDQINQMLQSYSFEQQMEILAEIEGYVSVPVLIDQFIDDPYYLGNMFGGVHEDGDYQGQPKVWPFWRRHLRDIYPNPFTSPYEEICITGAIGTGKSSSAIVGVLYDLYRLLLLRDPHAKFNVGENKMIATALFTATKTLGNVVLYQALMDAINASPFFKRLYHKKKYQPNVIFPHNIGIINGSQFKDALGTDIIQGIIDEANFQDVRLNQVVDNYSNIKRRIVSRFMKKGNLPCRLWVISSKTENDSFLENHINQSRNNPRVKIVEAALWEAHGHLKEKYCGRKFRVFCGDTTKEPQIVPDGMPIPESMDASKIIDVPVEYYNDFELDILGSLRDIAGQSTTSKYKLFRSREQLNRALIVPPAFVKDVITLEEYNDKDCIQDYLAPEFWQIGMRDAPHFLHMDTALTTDRFGIAMCHVHGRKEIKRTDHITGKTSVFQEMIIMHDFCLGIQAKPGQEIPFERVFNFIVWLREIGFNLGSINTEFLSRTGKASSYDQRTGGGIITVDGFQCFTGDTKISLINGTEVPIKDLVGKEFEVYSYDLEGKRIRAGKATNCRKTGENAQLIKVTLDNGEEIKCTLNHCYLMRDGEYKEAQLLQVGDSLMPLHRKDDGWGYEMVYEVDTKMWGRTHIKFARELYPHFKPSRHDQKGHVIHHSDCNKRNNATDNLIFCESQAEHLKYHMSPEHLAKAWEGNKRWHREHKEQWRKDVSARSKAQWANPTQRMVKCLRKFNAAGIAYQRSEVGRKHISKIMSIRQTGRTGYAHNHYRKDITNAMVYEKYLELGRVYKVAEFFGVHREFVRVRLAQGGYDIRSKAEKLTVQEAYDKYLELKSLAKVAEFFEVSVPSIHRRVSLAKKNNNHKVVKVEFVTIREDVYDFEVEQYHNFALTAGVFVHNSREMQQRLRKQGFEVHELSVDKTKTPYIAFKRAVLEERVFCPRNELLAKELLDVEDTGKAIDHTLKGSKDCSDACVGAFFSCLENAHSSHLYADVLLEQMADAVNDGKYIWNGRFGTFV